VGHPTAPAARQAGAEGDGLLRRRPAAAVTHPTTCNPAPREPIQHCLSLLWLLLLFFGRVGVTCAVPGPHAGHIHGVGAAGAGAGGGGLSYLRTPLPSSSPLTILSSLLCGATKRILTPQAVAVELGRPRRHHDARAAGPARPGLRRLRPHALRLL
jgi:hypothetical protein